MKKPLENNQLRRLKLHEVCRRMPLDIKNIYGLSLTTDILIDAHKAGRTIFRRTEGGGIRLLIMCENGTILFDLQWDKDNKLNEGFKSHY